MLAVNFNLTLIDANHGMKSFCSTMSFFETRYYVWQINAFPAQNHFKSIYFSIILLPLPPKYLLSSQTCYNDHRLFEKNDHSHIFIFI